MLEEYCERTGRSKTAVIRYQILKLNQESPSDLAGCKVKRIPLGAGKLLSELIREMRR